MPMRPRVPSAAGMPVAPAARPAAPPPGAQPGGVQLPARTSPVTLSRTPGGWNPPVANRGWTPPGGNQVAGQRPTFGRDNVFGNDPRADNVTNHVGRGVNDLARDSTRSSPAADAVRQYELRARERPRRWTRRKSYMTASTLAICSIDGPGGRIGGGYSSDSGYGTSTGGYGSYSGYSNPYSTDTGAAASDSTTNATSTDPTSPTTTATSNEDTPNSREDVSAAVNRRMDAALVAFRSGDYAVAQSECEQAIHRQTTDANLHEFRALCQFAQGKYKDAAATLHSLLAAGPGWNWNTLSSLYAPAQIYTKQLRTLEQFVRGNPSDAAGHFVLAYHYLVLDARDSALRPAPRGSQAPASGQAVGGHRAGPGEGEEEQWHAGRQTGAGALDPTVVHPPLSLIGAMTRAVKPGGKEP